MKKKRFIAMFVLLIILMLAACSNTTQNVTDAEDEELSFGEITVMNEEEDTEKIEVTIYYGNGASQELNTEIVSLDELSAENLIDALGRHNIVSLGTKVNSFEEQGIDDTKALSLDMSKTFREYLRTMAKEGENVILSSVAATFLEAYGADSIMITVDGEVIETEHAVYEEPFHFSAKQLLLPEDGDDDRNE